MSYVVNESYEWIQNLLRSLLFALASYLRVRTSGGTLPKNTIGHYFAKAEPTLSLMI